MDKLVISARYLLRLCSMKERRMVGLNTQHTGTRAARPLSLAMLARKAIALAIPVSLLLTLHHARAQEQPMMVRISEIQIHTEHLERYKAILKEEAEASVRLEPGVIAIFPMYQREDPSQIRILEMYADRQAYETHLKTPHFKQYKTTTLHMVKSLKLVDMQALDAQTMGRMFSKMKGDR